MKLYNDVNFLLSRAAQTVSQTYKDLLDQYDMTPSQYIILRCLWEWGSLSPGQLAEATYIERPAITGILSRLEDKNMIRRVPDYYDRRAVNICLTEKAVQMKEDIQNAAELAHANILADLSEQQKIEFLELLHRIANIPFV